jgi:hypothetical protein
VALEQAQLTCRNRAYPAVNCRQKPVLEDNISRCFLAYINRHQTAAALFGISGKPDGMTDAQ